MEWYIIVERYADNGELSHRALVDSTDGRELGTDGGEPEDQSFWRDWAWVPDELNKAQATVEALQAQLVTLKRHAGLDCGDQSCLYALTHSGMRTNGGCRCSPKRMKDDLERSRKAVEALQRDRIFKEYVRLFRLCEPIAKMLSELSILPIGCSREQELAWKMAVKNFRHYQRDYAADVLLQAALTPAGGQQREVK